MPKKRRVLKEWLIMQSAIFFLQLWVYCCENWPAVFQCPYLLIARIISHLTLGVFLHLLRTHCFVRISLRGRESAWQFNVFAKSKWLCHDDSTINIVISLSIIITGPPTHSVGGPILFCFLASVIVVCCCCLSSSVTLHGGPAGGFTRAGQAMPSCYLQSNYTSMVTLHSEPVVLRPFRATSC